MARGRAWGNALGGYKRQRRDSKGRFAGGSVGGRAKSAAKSAAKRTKKKYKNRGGRAATTLRNARKRPYDKAALNKQLQNNHRLTIASNYVGVYGGAAAGAALGGAYGGPAGAMLGRNVGAVYGQIAVGTALRKSGRMVTNQHFIKAGKDDQAAMARRIKRSQMGHMAIQGAVIGHSAHRLMQMQRPGGGNTYGLAADAIRKSRGSGPRTARAGRFGVNKGVYNINTSGRKVPRVKHQRFGPRMQGKARMAKRRVRTEAGYARSAFYGTYGF